MNSQYEHQVFWTPDLSLLGEDLAETFCETITRKMKAEFMAEAERLFYTAQEGSLLDRIWKGERIPWALKNPDKQG